MKNSKARNFYLLVVMVGMLLAIVFSLAAYELTKKEVALEVDGEVKLIKTHLNTVGELLSNEGVKVEKHDFLSVSSDSEIIDDMKIIVKNSKKIDFNHDGNVSTIFTTKETIADMIEAGEIPFKPQDELSIATSSEVEDGMELALKTAFEVTYLNGLEKRKSWATSTTVADFLKAENIVLGEFDRVEPSLDEVVNGETNIKIIKVEKVTDVVEERTTFHKTLRKDSSLEKGKEKIITAGEEGLLEKKYEVVLENGEEVSRTLVSTATKKESKDQVVAVGTKEIQTVSRGGQAGKEFVVEATAYTAYCTGCSGITRTGINLRKNPHLKVIAVDPRIIPLGSRVWVEGYGEAIAGDTGGAIKGNKIDVFIETRPEALAWGRRQVRIKILN